MLLNTLGHPECPQSSYLMTLNDFKQLFKNRLFDPKISFGAQGAIEALEKRRFEGLFHRKGS